MSNAFIQYGDNLRVVPVFHNRISFSLYIVNNLNRMTWNPDVIAVELPPSFKEPIEEGLGLQSPGPLWIGKRIRERLETTPINQMSGLSHTDEANQATIRLLLDARRYAYNKGQIVAPPSCTIDEWLTQHDRGFDPVVIICNDTDEQPQYFRNIVLPERIYLASEAFGGTRNSPTEGNSKYTSVLNGRSWYTPLFKAEAPLQKRSARSEWISGGNEDFVPRQYPAEPLDERENWKHRLLRRAVQYCRSHVLYIAPSDIPPASDLLKEAHVNGRRIVHIPVEALDQTALKMVACDELELKPHPSYLIDPVIEVFSLHSGDAFLAALRYAKDNGIDIAWVDRELEHVELSLANSRPLPEILIEDVLLDEEGLYSFYTRNRLAAESTRIEAIDSKRELHMAAYLKQLISMEKQVLFVCGAAHWSPIQNFLEEPCLNYELPESESQLGNLFCSGPSSWMLGSDELPLIMVAYEDLYRKGELTKFSLLQAHEDLQLRVRKRLEKIEGVSPADILVFKNYLNRLCKLTGVVVPQLYHWIEASNACLIQTGQREVFQEINKFWRQCPDGVQKMLNIRWGDKGLQADIDGVSYSIRSRWASAQIIYDANKSEFQNQDCKENGTVERDESEDQPGTHYSDENWELHMREMMLLAKRFASPKVRVVNTVPLTGVQRGSLDARATIRARTRGDDRIYERVETRAFWNSLNEFENFDPVVWLFKEDISSDLKFMWIDDERDDIHGIYVGSPFQLFASWVPRFSDSDKAMEKRIRRWLNSRKKFVPSSDALSETVSDREWDNTSSSEKVLILALEYSISHVICVSYNLPSKRVLSAFRNKKRDLLHINLNLFDEQDIEYLRLPEFGPRS